MHYVVFSGVDIYIMQYVVSSRVSTIDTIHKEVFSGREYYFYYALRNIYGGQILIYYAQHCIFGR